MKTLLFLILIAVTAPAHADAGRRQQYREAAHRAAAYADSVTHIEYVFPEIRVAKFPEQATGFRGVPWLTSWGSLIWRCGAIYYPSIQRQPFERKGRRKFNQIDHGAPCEL